MLRGHLWTIAPRVRHAVRGSDDTAPPTVEERPWSLELPDERWGSVRLTGRLAVQSGSTSLVVVVPGLGGSRRSHYMPGAARAIAGAGLSYLLLELRGSDLSGEDLYHAGLVVDVAGALGSDELAGFSSIHLLGYSLGGHLALRYAALDPDPRLRSVAAVCSPLDLAKAQQEFDRPSRWLYRQYILNRLRRIYRPIDRRRDLASPLEEVLAAKTIREWDRLTVVPRFGFEDPEDYYRQMSVAGRLSDLQVPALLVASDSDPMVPPEALCEVLDGDVGRLEVRRVASGGHVAFPEDLELGFDASAGLENQIVAWARSREV